MCSTQTVTKVLNGVLTTLNSFGTIEGLTTNTTFEQIVKQLQQLEVDSQSWKKGDPAQTFITVLTDAEAAFKLLPVPEVDQEIADVILAGITTLIGIFDANGAVTTPTGATASDTEIKEHQSEVAMATTSAVKTLVPGFHYRKGFLGLFRENPEHAYFDEWNKVIGGHGEKWATAHVDY